MGEFASDFPCAYIVGRYVTAYGVVDGFSLCKDVPDLLMAFKTEKEERWTVGKRKL